VKRLTQAVFLSFVLLSLVCGQNSPKALSESGFEEPENHAITLARLIRHHDSGEYERKIRKVMNSARDHTDNANRYTDIA
jgi:hypothetical protein